MDTAIALRLLFVLPAIFVVTYLLTGWLLTVFWIVLPYLLGAGVLLALFALIAAAVS